MKKKKFDNTERTYCEDLAEKWATTHAKDDPELLEHISLESLSDLLMTERAKAAGKREEELRKYLWLNHGHNRALYGDDGEMQCIKCKVVDYKRGHMDNVIESFVTAVSNVPSDVQIIDEKKATLTELIVYLNDKVYRLEDLKLKYTK